MFEEVWKMYPRKVKKKYAKKVFDSLSKEDQKIVYETISKHVEQWANTEMQYIPHLSSWLNDERWTDELEEVNIAKTLFLRSVK